MSSRPGIVTPEAVVLDFARAGVASRAGALALDLLALGTAWTVLFAVVAETFGALEPVFGAVLAVLFSSGLYLAWFAGFETFLQRTPGKAAFGLRVVSLDGTPVRFQQAFLRALFGLFDFFVLPFGFVAVVVSLLSPVDQRLGDLVAGTLVVRQRTAGRGVVPARFQAPAGYEGYMASLDVGALSDTHYELVRRFLLRASGLRPMARSQVAVRIANPLAGLLRHDPPPQVHPEVFLICVAAAWQRAQASRLSG